MGSVETELKGFLIAGLGGDERAYRELLGRVSRLLRGYYKSKLARADRSAADAEDLVQETLMALHVRRDTFDPAQPFTPWLYAIARYKLIDYYRRTRRSVANVSIDDVSEIVAHDDQVSTESSLDLDRLLDELPSKFRTAIRCVKLEGLSVAEAAVRQGLSDSAVKVNVHRGMKALGRPDRQGTTIMKTDDLVTILSTNLDPVDWRGVSRKLLSAVALGAIAALTVMMLWFGPRTDISDARAWIFLAVKCGFAGAIVALSLAYLVRVARPSGEQRVSLVSVILPFAAALVTLVVTLVLAPPSDWREMIFGQHWLLCVACIPLNAIFPFVAIIFALRQFALPTHLAWAGALAGRAAGSTSAAVYALHCTDDSLAFVALWYGLTIALCTVVGALLGPRLLRW